MAPAAGRRGGPGPARRGRAPGLPARPGGQRHVRVQSRGCDRHRGTVPPRRRGQRTPRSSTTGGSRKSSATPAQTSRLLPARSPTPPASPNRPPPSPGPVATSPTPPSSSASPRAVTYSPATRPGRSRWPARRSRWPGRSAIRRSSPAACSPSARPSPRPTPNRPAPACARVSSSARRSAIKAPSTTSGPPGSHFS